MTTIIKASGVTIPGLPKLGRDVVYQNDANAVTLGLLDFGNQYCTGPITNNQIADTTVLRNLVDGVGAGQASGVLPVSKNGIVMSNTDTTKALLGTGFDLKTHIDAGRLPSADYAVMINAWVTFDSATPVNGSGFGDSIVGSTISNTTSVWTFVQSVNQGGGGMIVIGYGINVAAASAGETRLLTGLIYPKSGVSGQFDFGVAINKATFTSYTAATKLYTALANVTAPTTAPAMSAAQDSFRGKVHRVHMVKILNASPLVYARTLAAAEYDANYSRFV